MPRYAGPWPVRRVLFLAVCLLAALCAALGATTASAAEPGPAPSSATDRFLAEARASLTDADRADPLHAIRTIRRFAYRKLLFSGVGVGQINLDLDNKATDLESALKILSDSDDGLWCLGTSTVLAELYTALGYDTSVISWGANSALAHTQVLVKAQGEWYMEDAYFNYDYVGQDNAPLPYSAVLEAFRRGQPPRVRQDLDQRFGLFATPQNAAEYVPTDRQADIQCQGPKGRMRCAVTMTLARFAQSWNQRIATEDVLVANGLPEDRLDEASVFVRFASKTQPGKAHTDVDQPMLDAMRKITGCMADETHDWCAAEPAATAASSDQGPRRLDVSWTSLIKDRVLSGPAPIALTTPSKAYDFGAATLELVSRQAETLTVTLKDYKGKLGISLMTPDGARLLSREQVAQPSEQSQSFAFPAVPAFGRYIVVIRNYDDSGLAGVFTVEKVEKQLAAPRVRSDALAGQSKQQARNPAGPQG